MALVSFHAAALDVIPEADVRVQSPGEDEFAVGREADGRDGGVVLVDEGAQALAGCGVPDASMAPHKNVSNCSNWPVGLRNENMRT